jgi:hypothetical protein
MCKETKSEFFIQFNCVERVSNLAHTWAKHLAATERSLLASQRLAWQFWGTGESKQSGRGPHLKQFGGFAWARCWHSCRSPRQCLQLYLQRLNMNQRGNITVCQV